MVHLPTSVLLAIFLVGVDTSWSKRIRRKSSVIYANADSLSASHLADLREPPESRSVVMFLKSPLGMGLGVAFGVAITAFASRSIWRTKQEAARIQKLFDANTSVEQLQRTVDSGEELPSLVILRGVISADGPDVEVISPKIDGLKEKVGQIDQPEDDFLKIARMAKTDASLKPLIDKVAAETGIRASDIPDVADDFTNTTHSFGGNAVVLSEMLVARLSVSVSVSKDDDKQTIHRSPRKRSYCCFYARKISEGFHFLDMQGARIELKLPSAAILPQYSAIHHGEAPCLFLPTANVKEEFDSFIRKEGLTVNGQHLDFSNMQPSKVTDPDTLMSKFIFIDVQSTTDLGGMSHNTQVLQAISEGYNGAKMLWEPLGFYDDDATIQADKVSQMVSPEELMEKAARAASLNSEQTRFCGPTFSREQLVARRDEENCFRYTELAIPRGSDVTVLAKPVKGSDGKLSLVAPNSAEDGGDPDSPEAERFRFRMLKGHTVENLLKQRDVNIMKYYGFLVLGAFLTLWAEAGYPGLSYK